MIFAILAFCLRFYFTQNTLVRHSMVSNVWLPEEQDPLTIGRGRSFEIIIIVEKASIKTFVNWQPYMFLHRTTDLKRFKRLRILGDVIISHLHVDNHSVSSADIAIQI